MPDLFFLLAGDASTTNVAQANVCLSPDVLHPMKNIVSESTLHMLISQGMLAKDCLKQREAR